MPQLLAAHRYHGNGKAPPLPAGLPQSLERTGLLDDGSDDAGADGAAAFADREAQLFFHRDRNDRSEEHTSELQSLMRISYAVFCLKKKKKTKNKSIQQDESRK